jgi:hypothetical protein
MCQCIRKGCVTARKGCTMQFAGLFSRAVKQIGKTSEITAIAAEATELRKVLAQKLTEVLGNLSYHHIIAPCTMV